jgi:dTDP-4-amino-4,6-dideoxygalactose transaminase
MLIKYRKDNGVLSVFHYLSLHLSGYYKANYTEIPHLPFCDRFADCLLRLPMFYELKDEELR